MNTPDSVIHEAAVLPGVPVTPEALLAPIAPAVPQEGLLGRVHDLARSAYIGLGNIQAGVSSESKKRLGFGAAALGAGVLAAKTVLSVRHGVELGHPAAGGTSQHALELTGHNMTGATGHALAEAGSPSPSVDPSVSPSVDPFLQHLKTHQEIGARQERAFWKALGIGAAGTLGGLALIGVVKKTFFGHGGHGGHH